MLCDLSGRATILFGVLGDPAVQEQILFRRRLDAIRRQGQRVDKVVVFRQLQKRDIRQIVDIILNEVNHRLVEHELVLEATDGARDWLGEKGYDADFGARPLRRLIQTEIEDQLSDLVLAGEFKDGEDIVVDVDEEGKLILRHKENKDTQDEVEEAVTSV